MARTPQTPRQRALARLGKFLTSAEDRDNAHEAAVARERADALIAKHGVTAAELATLALKRRGKSKVDAGPCDRPWAEALAFVVGRAAECKSLKRKVKTVPRALFDGYRADEAAAIYCRLHADITSQVPLTLASCGYAHIPPFHALWDAIFGGAATRALADPHSRVAPSALHSLTNDEVQAAVDAAQRVVQHPGSIIRLFVQFANEAGHGLGQTLVLAPATAPPPAPAAPAPVSRDTRAQFTVTPGFVAVALGQPGNYATLFCADRRDADGLGRSRHFRGDLSAFDDVARTYSWVFECTSVVGQVAVFATADADAVGVVTERGVVATTWSAHVERTSTGIPVRVVSIEEREEYAGALLSLAVV